MVESSDENKFVILRRQAENVLQGQSANLTNLSVEDIQVLIHNLQVHQIELEMQNEELRRVHLELESTRDRYAELYNFAPVGYFTLDANGVIVEANLTGASLLNIARSFLIGAPLSCFVYPEDQTRYAGYRVQLGQSREPQTVEIRLVRSDEFSFYARLEGLAMYDGDGKFMQSRVAVSDVSDRVQSAEAMRESDRLIRSTEQLRELSARLQSIREEERTHIARAIHDELGQTLTGLKMDVAWLQKHLDQSPSTLMAKTQDMSQLIDTTIQTVRRISTELRPGLLDDLGLAATIEWQLQEFQTRTGIEGKLISAPEETTLDADGATTVFRIFQEILTNVVRHAQATRVEVTLEETATDLILRVQDNGRGMTEGEIHNPKSIGLLGMQERARLRAGEIQFYGNPDHGTIIIVRLPLLISKSR